MTEEYYQIGPSLDNIDFYVGGITISLFLSSEVTVDPVNATRIVPASSSVSCSINSSFNSSKIAYSSSSMSATLNKTVTTLELLNVLMHAHIEVTLSVSLQKIAYSSSDMGLNLNAFATLIKTAFGSTHIHNNIYLAADYYAIRNGTNTPGFSIISNLSAFGSEILGAEASISILSKFLVNPPIRFSPDFIDAGSIRTLLLLDGKPLTNHNRNLDISRSPIYLENRNWNNRSNRYYKRQSNSDRATFSISWSFLPNYREKTVDNRMARDYISSIAEDPDVHVLKVINQNENDLTPYTETTYNVFVRGYSESLIRRDLQDGVYYFDCNLTLEEA